MLEEARRGGPVARNVGRWAGLKYMFTLLVKDKKVLVAQDNKVAVVKLHALHPFVR